MRGFALKVTFRVHVQVSLDHKYFKKYTLITFFHRGESSLPRCLQEMCSARSRQRAVSLFSASYKNIPCCLVSFILTSICLPHSLQLFTCICVCPPPPHLWFRVSGEQRGGQVLVQDPHIVLFQSAPADPTAAALYPPPPPHTHIHTHIHTRLKCTTCVAVWSNSHSVCVCCQLCCDGKSHWSHFKRSHVIPPPPLRAHKPSAHIKKANVACQPQRGRV